MFAFALAIGFGPSTDVCHDLAVCHAKQFLNLCGEPYGGALRNHSIGHVDCLLAITSPVILSLHNCPRTPWSTSGRPRAFWRQNIRGTASGLRHA